MHYRTLLVALFILSFSLNSWAVEFNQLAPDLKQDLEEERYKVRIKDIVAIEGIRENILVGYGLVVGLNNTGDNLKNSIFTQQELENFLAKVGMNARGGNLKIRSAAAVTVTANLPAFARSGVKIDVTVSTLGDAQSLYGGTLIATPLLGADGEVYAVAQGSISSFREPRNQNNQRGREPRYTSSLITNGAIVERGTGFNLNNLKTLHLSLLHPDLSTAQNIASTINSLWKLDELPSNYLTLDAEPLLDLLEETIKKPPKAEDIIANAIDSATVKIRVPKEYYNNLVAFLAKIEKFPVKTDNTARIVIDEKTGTIIIDKNVRVKSVAISQANLMLQIRNDQDEVKDQQVLSLDSNTTLHDLVQGLNALGISTPELINILHNMKKIGALQAEIIIK